MFIQSPLNLYGAKENYEENEKNSSQILESSSASTSSVSSTPGSTNEKDSHWDHLGTSSRVIDEPSKPHQGSSKKFLAKRPVPNLQQRPVPNICIADKENADPIANELPVKKDAKMIPSKKKSSDNFKVFGIRSIHNIKYNPDDCQASKVLIADEKPLPLQPIKRSRLASGGSTCKRKRSNQEENFSFPSALLEVVGDEDSFSGPNVIDNDASPVESTIASDVEGSESDRDEKKTENTFSLILDNIDENNDDDDVFEENDGFDICSLQSLDQGPLTEYNSPNDSGSSFTMKSLMANKLILDNDTMTKLSEAEQGSSPVLPEQREVKLTTTSHVDKNVMSSHHLRRSISMLETRRTSDKYFSAKLSPEHPKPVSETLDFTSPVSRVTFKRPAIPCSDDVDENQTSKRRKTVDSRPTLMSCPSMDNIVRVHCQPDKQNLTADGSRKLLLPTVVGNTNNRDLNNIDCHAMAALINGEYANQVASYRIIDARYVYEYKGGHIRGAENFGKWNEEAFMKEFLPDTLGPKELTDFSKTKEDSGNSFSAKRHILIFHCEFSSVRGPTLLRRLRKMDRDVNSPTYPALHYPECYLLHDGYKVFFENYPHLCEPQSYVRMTDPKFARLERDFHQRSKSWQAEGTSFVARTKPVIRRGKSCEDSAKPCMGKKSLF